MSNDRLQHQIDIIVENQARFSEDMLMLKDALLSLTNIVEEQGKQLAAMGKETDERINLLATFFEHHLTEDHGKDSI